MTVLVLVLTCDGRNQRLLGNGIYLTCSELRLAMATGKRITKKDLDAIERAAKRQAQKEAGALDGRFRPRVVPSRKRYSRKRKGDVENNGS